VKKRNGGPNPCLADFLTASDESGEGWLGFFALGAGFGLEEAGLDEYGSLLLSTLANSLAEAFSEELHRRVCGEFWAQSIRPAFGYPPCPDHQDKRLVFELLGARDRCGFDLSESAMIIPAASVCGMYFAHPGGYYFGLGRVGEDQMRDWADRKGISLEDARRRIGGI
jgi:5-methyltetrahydrofolate--homocysteine methyltransferase